MFFYLLPYRYALVFLNFVLMQTPFIALAKMGCELGQRNFSRLKTGIIILIIKLF